MAVLGLYLAGINELALLFGGGLVPILGEETSIAWEAHIGGFLIGFFGIRRFDRRGAFPA